MFEGCVTEALLLGRSTVLLSSGCPGTKSAEQKLHLFPVKSKKCSRFWEHKARVPVDAETQRGLRGALTDAGTAGSLST